MDAKEIEIGKLDGREGNPRRRLGDVAGLAASIRSFGILEPLVVRVKGKRYEVIAGHRRLAAAKSIKLRKVPCVVRTFDDLEAEGAALVENIQREGLEPIDEGDAIAALVDQGETIEGVAEKVGRSISYVAKRRQLATLHPKARAAVQKGEVSLGVALQIARLPKAQHVEALELLEGHTEESARSTIERSFLLRLADAPFSRTDPNLQPKAGACSKCPKRTGAQPALFDDVKGKDVCTDRACFDAKSALAWGARAVAHAAAGGEVIDDPAQIQKLLGWSERPGYSSGYVATDELIHLAGDDGESATLAELAKAKGLTPTVTLARTASGHVVEMYRRKDVGALYEKSATGDEPADNPAAPTNIMAHRAAARAARETTAATLAQLAPRCAAEGVELAGWRCLLALALEELAYSSMEDARIAELAEMVDRASLYALQSGLAEILLAYAAERRPGEVHPSITRFAEIHGVATEAPTDGGE